MLFVKEVDVKNLVFEFFLFSKNAGQQVWNKHVYIIPTEKN